MREERHTRAQKYKRACCDAIMTRATAKSERAACKRSACCVHAPSPRSRDPSFCQKCAHPSAYPLPRPASSRTSAVLHTTRNLRKTAYTNTKAPTTHNYLAATQPDAQPHALSLATHRFIPSIRQPRHHRSAITQQHLVQSTCGLVTSSPT
jgi:hypothetical protein